MNEQKRGEPPVPEHVKEAYVGKTGRMDFGGLVVNVKIKGVRNRYGKFDVYVTPVSGTGEVWVQTSRIQSVLE